jgi:hypothetical protein
MDIGLAAGIMLFRDALGCCEDRFRFWYDQINVESLCVMLIVDSQLLVACNRCLWSLNEDFLKNSAERQLSGPMFKLSF